MIMCNFKAIVPATQQVKVKVATIKKAFSDYGNGIYMGVSMKNDDGEYYPASYANFFPIKCEYKTETRTVENKALVNLRRKLRAQKLVWSEKPDKEHNNVQFVRIDVIGYLKRGKEVLYAA